MRLALRGIVAAAVLTGAAAPTQAQPSIRVCEHRNFGGRCVTLQHGVNDLRDWGISNKISSYRVYRGEWRLCTGTDFTGRCENVKGYVEDLNATPLQDSISSLRPIRGGGGSGGGWNDRTAIAVYTDSNYRGRSWVFTEDARDLGQFGLNNQISSVRVYGGRWQICELMNFQNCRTVTGDIANLSDIGMNNRISSIREGGNWGSGGPGRSGGPPGGGSGVPVVLFSNRGFGGESLEVHGEIRNLQDVGFNDAASSIRVSRGRWQLCSDANFRGSCQIVTSSISRLSASLERRVSSIRPY